MWGVGLAVVECVELVPSLVFLAKPMLFRLPGVLRPPLRNALEQPCARGAVRLVVDGA